MCQAKGNAMKKCEKRVAKRWIALCLTGLIILPLASCGNGEKVKNLASEKSG